MRLDNSWNDKIDDYLSGEMSDADLASFEAELKVNEALQNEIQLQRDVMEAVVDHDLIDFRAKVRNVIDSEKSESNRNRFVIPIVAASLMLIAILGYLIQSNFSGPDHQKIFAEYFVPYDNLITTRADSNVDTRVLEAMELYDQRDYASALGLLEQVEQKSPLLELYKGVCYLGLENSIDARKSLSSIKSTDKSYYQSGIYYLALSYILENKLEEAEAILEQRIDDNNSSSYSKASELLKAIKK